MERFALNVDVREELVGDFDALGIAIGIEFSTNGQAGTSRCGANQIDDDLMADQWAATPIHADK